MKKIFRTINLLILCLILAATVWLNNNSERLRAGFKSKIESNLSAITGGKVSIGHMKIGFPLRLELNGIDFLLPDNSVSAAEIDKIVITPDILSLLSKDTLTLGLSVLDFRSDDTSADIYSRAEILKKRTWQETFSSPIVGYIEFIDGQISYRDYSLEGLSGRVNLKDNSINDGKLLFTSIEKTFFLDITGYDHEEVSLTGSLHADDFTLTGVFSQKKDRLIIERFVGSPFSVNSDLKGIINSVSVPGERSFELEGYSSGNMTEILSFFVDREKIENIVDEKTFFSTSFAVFFTEKDFLQTKIDASLYVNGLASGDISLSRISAEISLESGRLKIPEMSFFLGLQPVELEFTADLDEEKLPVALKVSTSSMDVRTALDSSIFQEDALYGPLDLDITLTGSWHEIYSVISHFTEHKKILDKKDMLSRLELKGQINLGEYRKDNFHIMDISAEFSFENSVLNIPCVSFRSFGGKLQSAGQFSFLEDDIPSELDISIQDMNIQHIAEVFSDGNISGHGSSDMSLNFRGPLNFILEFFNEVNSTENPELLRNSWRTLLAPGYRERIDDVFLEISTNIPLLYIHGAKITDIKGKFKSYEGSVSLPEMSFKAFGGYFNSSAQIFPQQDSIPLNFEVSARSVDPSKIQFISPEKNGIQEGMLDAEIDFTGSGHLLSGFAARSDFRNKQKNKIKAFWRDALDPELVDLVKKVILSVDMTISETGFDQLSIESMRLKSHFERGEIHVPILYLDSEDGFYRADGRLSINTETFPLTFNLRAQNAHIDNLWKILHDSSPPFNGSSNIDLSFVGNGSILAELPRHISNIDNDFCPESFDKVISILNLATQNPLFSAQKINTSFYFNTIRADKIKIRNLAGNISLDSGKICAPDLTGTFYRGPFTSRFDADLNVKGYPFRSNTNIRKSDLRALIIDTTDPETLIYGNFDLEFNLDGYLESQSSYTGYGTLEVYDANLGRVPILTPLLGWIYEGLEDIFPAFRKININSASSSFDIKDRKVSTKDLTLSGTDICLVARGSLDFDGNLNFYFENELIERFLPEETDWPVAIRNFITSFGRTISRARLRGTLENQKWDFEYIAPIRKNVSEHLRSFFEGISRQ